MPTFGLFCKRLFSSSTLYTRNHEWIMTMNSLKSVNSEEKILKARVGITEYSQKALGDIVFIEMPKVGEVYSEKDALAIVESVKGASDVYSPVKGKVTKINSPVESKPSIINKSAESDGWICEIECFEKDFAASNLLDLSQYKEFCKQ